MDSSNHFEAIVDELVKKIYQQVQDRAQENIDQFLEQKLAESDLESKISNIAARQLQQRINDYEFDTKHLSVKLADAGAHAVAELKSDIQHQVEETINLQLNQTDVKALVREQITEMLEERMQTAKFPDRSISHKAIDFSGVELSGDMIRGGIITKFGSSGIDDQATKCQVTILDSNVVVESPIVTTGMNVHGDAVIAGKLDLRGGFDKQSTTYSDLLSDTATAVRETLDKELFLSYSDLVTNNIIERGIDFKEVLINGRLALSEERLGPSVIRSNLRKVGELEELQVRGETFLSETAYISKGRLGINTTEPTMALSVWDEDVEVLVGKKSPGRAFIGTNRQSSITLSANGKDNISLEPDGSVTINDLRLGALPLSTASTDPNWEGRSGEIVFNDSPAIGKPIGWVCLQGHRWAKFGIIQE